jgi:hypothetical protein
MGESPGLEAVRCSTVFCHLDGSAFCSFMLDDQIKPTPHTVIFSRHEIIYFEKLMYIKEKPPHNNALKFDFALIIMCQILALVFTVHI